MLGSGRRPSAPATGSLKGKKAGGVMSLQDHVNAGRIGKVCLRVSQRQIVSD